MQNDISSHYNLLARISPNSQIKWLLTVSAALCLIYILFTFSLTLFVAMFCICRTGTQTQIHAHARTHTDKLCRTKTTKQMKRNGFCCCLRRALNYIRFYSLGRYDTNVSKWRQIICARLSFHRFCNEY